MLSKDLNNIPCPAWGFRHHTHKVSVVQLALMSVESLTLQASNKHNLQVDQKSLRVGDLTVRLLKGSISLEHYYTNKMKKDLEWNKKHTRSPRRQKCTTANWTHTSKQWFNLWMGWDHSPHLSISLYLGLGHCVGQVFPQRWVFNTEERQLSLAASMKLYFGYWALRDGASTELIFVRTVKNK